MSRPSSSSSIRIPTTVPNSGNPKTYRVNALTLIHWRPPWLSIYLLPPSQEHLLFYLCITIIITSNPTQSTYTSPEACLISITPPHFAWHSNNEDSVGGSLCFCCSGHTHLHDHCLGYLYPWKSIREYQQRMYVCLVSIECVQQQ